MTISARGAIRSGCRAPLWALGARVALGRERSSLTGLADQLDFLVRSDHCLELRMAVARLEQEVGRFAAGQFICLGLHEDVIHATRIAALADDLELVDGYSTGNERSRTRVVHLPKQNLVLGNPSIAIVHSASTVSGQRNRCPRR
jgi:hypothetical protein